MNAKGSKKNGRPPVKSLLNGALTDLILNELTPVEAEYANDVAAWALEKLGIHLWSKQKEFCNSVLTNRYTAVPSCHDVGKSFGAAILACHWIDTHPAGEAFVVTSAPTGPQVSAILWREMRRIHAQGNLPGRITLANEWYIEVNGQETLVAYGRKPGEHTGASGFSGIHAKYVLVILDEACGIPKWLFEAADTLATNENSHVFAVGNPDDPQTQFAEVCKPGSGWNVIPISAYDSPNFTNEITDPVIAEIYRDMLISETWVNERIKRWGKNSALFSSKVLGKFPDVSEHAVFTPTMIREAQERDLPGLERGTKAFDIARMGSNKTVGYWNRGGVIRKIYEVKQHTTTEAAGEIGNLLKPEPDVQAWIDCDGLGVGVYDLLQERKLPVLMYRGSERAKNPNRFINKRAESTWALREAMLDEMIDLDPEDEDLAAQLGQIRYYVDSRGRIGIESKDEMEKRGVPSPDHADAAIMSLVYAGTIQVGGGSLTKQTSTITGDLLNREM